MENKSTHFIFNGEKVIISPDLRPIASFLSEIDKEIESLLSFDKKLDSIQRQCVEIMQYSMALYKKLKEKGESVKFDFLEAPTTIAEKLKFSVPIRSEMIALFAYIETIFCLDIAYKNNISSEEKIIRKAMSQNNVKFFLEEFCLNKENEWCQKNAERLDHITADDLRKLRNSLTHFFSVAPNISVSHAALDEKSRKIEKATNFAINFMTPEDLYGIVRGAGRLMIGKWDEDYKNSEKTKTNEFKNRILSVKSVIENSGAVIVEAQQISI